MQGAVLEVMLAVVTSIIGVLCLTGAIEGYMFKYWSSVSRVMLAVAALCTLIPGTVTDLIGVGLIAVGYVLDKFIFKPGPKNN